jgi:hypothetical protein
MNALQTRLTGDALDDAAAQPSRTTDLAFPGEGNSARRRRAGLGSRSAHAKPTAGVPVTHLPAGAVIVAQTGSLAHPEHAEGRSRSHVQLASVLHNTKLQVPKKPKNASVQVIVSGHSEFRTQNCAPAPDSDRLYRRAAVERTTSVRASGAMCVHPR